MKNISKYVLYLEIGTENRQLVADQFSLKIPPELFCPERIVSCIGVNSFTN